VIPDVEEFCAWGLLGSQPREVRLDGEPVGEVWQGQECLSLNPNGEQPPPVDLAAGKTISVWDGATRLDDLVIADIGVTYADAIPTAPGAGSSRSARPRSASRRTGTVSPSTWSRSTTPTATAGGMPSTTAVEPIVDLRDGQSQVVARVYDGTGLHGDREGGRGSVAPALRR